MIYIGLVLVFLSGWLIRSAIKGKLCLRCGACGGKFYCGHCGLPIRHHSKVGEIVKVEEDFARAIVLVWWQNGVRIVLSKLTVERWERVKNEVEEIKINALKNGIMLDCGPLIIWWREYFPESNRWLLCWTHGQEQGESSLKEGEMSQLYGSTTEGRIKIIKERRRPYAGNYIPRELEGSRR